jgi:DNA mismatch endonuclease (patch repair protein)
MALSDRPPRDAWCCRAAWSLAMPPSACDTRRQRDRSPRRKWPYGLHCTAQVSAFFKHRRPIAGLRCEVDIVFPGPRVAVFVDGCFWHGCPEHATFPKTNAEWWARKLEANRRRDLANERALNAAG